jgi:hypothetical protein
MTRDDEPVSVQVALEPGPVDGRRILTVTVTIAPGYHVYAEPTPPGFVPLSVRLAPASATVAGPPAWPPAERLTIEDLPDEFWVYHGTVVGRLPIEVRSGVVEGEVAYQACTEVACYLPTSVAFRLSADG